MNQEGFGGALEGEDEVKITFSKKSGGKRTIPIWFTVKGRTLELLPMYGLKTKWFADVEAAGSLELKVRDQVKVASPKVIRDPEMVEEIKQRFGVKYGEDDVRKYYPTSDVAFEISL
jgi:hypothetical protein